MTKQNDNCKDDIIGDWLNAISRTALLFNTKQELAEHIGYPALMNNNSLSKIKEPFRKRAILHELEREVKSYTLDGYDLEMFLDDYEEASRFYKRNIIGHKPFDISNKNNIVGEMLDYVYGDHILAEKLSKNQRNLFCKIYDAERDREKIDASILLALILGVLPEYDSRKGDVENINGDFNVTFAYLESYFTERQYHNAQLKIFLDQFRGKSKDNLTRNRLSLVYSIWMVLVDYKFQYNEQERYELNTDLEEEYRRLPDIEDCFWEESSYKQDVKVFWTFTLNGSWTYFLDRYEYKDKQLKKLRYECVFLREEGILYVVVNHPDYVKELLKGDYSSFQNRAKFQVEYDCDNDTNLIDRIQFIPVLSNPKVFSVNELHRIKDEGRIERYKNLGPAQLVDSYRFWKTAYAITRDAIFFQDFEEIVNEKGDVDIKLKDNSFYELRMPEDDDILFNITLKDNIGIMILDGRKYIYIAPIYKSFDITTEEDMASNGVIKTNHIFN